MTTTQTRPAARAVVSRPSGLPTHWPLTVMLLGFPLWWILGLAELAPMALCGVMGLQLWRRRVVRVPAGFGWWLLFLVWVVLGAFLLWADAPGAVPGGGPARLVVFTYRVVWYVCITVALLWVVNTDRTELSDRRVIRLFAYMFVVTTVGGLAGVVAPEVELRSALELVLPGQVASNSFVRSIIHPALADIQTFLGYPEARPKAPFAFANSWGSNFSFFLLFFLVGWLGRQARWRRLVAPLVLMVAAVPVIYSLNRGLWGSLIVGALLVVALQVLRGRVMALVALGAVAVASVVLFTATPLNDMLQERLANGHSNDRRGELLVQTVRSTLEGSPVAGFGSTRDVQGSFASIAGGSTPDCPACGVPPLGTQGHLWLVIFSQGMVGTLLFLTFFGLCLARTIRCRTVLETMCTAALLFFTLQLLVYDTLGMPMLTLMVLIGLVWREQHPPDQIRSRPLPTLTSVLAPLLRARRLVVAAVVVGAVTGAAVAAQTPRSYAVRTSILLAPSPLYISTDLLDPSQRAPREISVDTEAALVFSEATTARLAAGERNRARLRDDVRVTAVANSRVLTIEVRDSDPAVARRAASALSTAYLQERRDYLADRRTQVLTGLRERLFELEALGDLPTTSGDGTTLSERDAINAAINNIVLTSTDAGEAIRATPPAPVRRQIEIDAVSGAEIMLLGVVAVVGLGVTRPRLGFRPRPRPQESS